MKLVFHAVGARPNFVKIAPVVRALGAFPGIRQRLIHTGQHYDKAMSDDIFADLGLPQPHRFLGVGSGRHGEQTARTLDAFEALLYEQRPDLVVVVGDVNSTLACALAAAKLGVRVAHVEAGLRSGDWTMPEEINRVLTDRLSDLLFTHSREAVDNLAAEGIDTDRVFEVGNTMIDSLRRFEHAAHAQRAWAAHEVEEGAYVLVTLHRPSNVDDPARLQEVAAALEALAQRSPVVFPVHPRTAAALRVTGAGTRLAAAGVRLTGPVGYLPFLSLLTGAGAVLTDSGGVQEETSALGIPCFTLRPNTERPVTLHDGTNTLLGDDTATIAQVRLRERAPHPADIPGWDGHAGERVAAVLAEALGVEPCRDARLTPA